MPATHLDILIEQGITFERNIQIRNKDGTAKDLTGYSGRMQIRPTEASATVLLDANTANGMITINSPGGIVTITVGADITTPLAFTTAYYDVEIFSSTTNVIRILKGSASLSLEVTR